MFYCKYLLNIYYWVSQILIFWHWNNLVSKRLDNTPTSCVACVYASVCLYAAQDRTDSTLLPGQAGGGSTAGLVWSRFSTSSDPVQ